MRALPLCAVLAGCTFGADFAGTAYLCPAGDCPSGYTCVDGRCVTGAATVDAAPPPSWWDEDWRARRRLAIRNVADTALPAGFQVGWRADLPGELGETAFDAVRVVSYQPASDTWSEIARVVDGAVAADEGVWFPLPAALEPDAEAAVWIYHDNPAAPAAPWSGGDVFEMVDNFSPLTTDAWVTSGVVVEEGNEIRFGNAAEMRSVEPWPVDRAIDIVARASDEASRFWFGFQRELPDFDPDVPWLIWVRREVGQDMQPEYAGPDDTFETRWSGTLVAVGQDPHTFTVERMRDRIVYRVDQAVTGDDHDHAIEQDHSAPLYIRFSNTGASSFWVDRVRLRRAAYPPPELTLGAREELPTP